MKALLVILIICISDNLCQGGKVSEKVYPKKYKPYASGKILINPEKYEKVKSNQRPVLSAAKSYTAFHAVGSNPQMIQSGIPDSPYFPIDHQKSSVKKDLPEKPWALLRNKRSADVLIVSPAEKDETKAAEVPTAPTAGNKVETAVTPSSLPKEESKSIAIINTTQKSAVTKDAERSGKKPLKSKAAAPARKGQAKSKAKLIKASKTVVRKPVGKNAAARAKSKVKNVRKGKNIKRKQSMKKNKKNGKGNLQRSKKRKAKVNKARAGKVPKETRRLTGAREALIESYPYVVSIQKDEQHWCSGALLSPRLVITTANCLWKANRMSRMEVRAGSRHSNRGGQIAGIQEVMKHPNWGLRKNPDNDVAFLVLNKNIKFSDEVHGVDLPNRVMLPPFDDAWITSWGAERRDGVYDNHDSTTLQVYHARLIEREKCNNVTMRFSVVVTENFICLAQSGRQAPCTRDTGAPAVSDGVLWGLASWGIRKLCGTERYPAMFSYLASHSNMDFIMNATRYLMSDKRQYPFADRYTGVKK